MLHRIILNLNWPRIRSCTLAGLGSTDCSQIAVTKQNCKRKKQWIRLRICTFLFILLLSFTGTYIYIHPHWLLTLPSRVPKHQQQNPRLLRLCQRRRMRRKRRRKKRKTKRTTTTNCPRSLPLDRNTPNLLVGIVRFAELLRCDTSATPLISCLSCRSIRAPSWIHQSLPPPWKRCWLHRSHRSSRRTRPTQCIAIPTGRRKSPKWRTRRFWRDSVCTVTAPCSYALPSPHFCG